MKNWFVTFIQGSLCLVALLCAQGVGAASEEPASPKTSALEEKLISSDQVIRQALTDTMYYNFDKWYEIFDRQIAHLEANPETLENQMELVKYYFYYSGLLGELCHVLAFTSKYKIITVEEEFMHFSNRAKELAHDILDSPGLTDKQQAEATLYLGAVEGYIAIFEYGAGNLLTALINGLRADNHLEEALNMDSHLIDAHFGLGLYRYGNSRLGGLGNFIMQGGKDLREVGLNHIERAIREDAPSKPLAMKTLIWFYISEQINKENREVPESHNLHPAKSRVRAMELMDELDDLYFKNHPDGFIGNKQLHMMRALQSILDKNYQSAKEHFEKIVEISDDLQTRKNFQINPQLIQSVTAGIKFCDLMLLSPSVDDEMESQSACLKINDQVVFLNGGGSMVEYDTKKIRGELHSVFVEALEGMAEKLNCKSTALPSENI